MSPPLPSEARRDDRRTAILPTVAEMRDLAAETLREHGAAAAVTQTDDTAWDLRADDHAAPTVCAPADAPTGSPIPVRADGVSAGASVALASDVAGLQVGAECRAAMRRDALAALARYVESLSVEEFMRHLGVSRHEAQRIREKALEDGI